MPHDGRLRGGMAATLPAHAALGETSQPGRLAQSEVRTAGQSASNELGLSSRSACCPGGPVSQASSQCEAVVLRLPWSAAGSTKQTWQLEKRAGAT